MTQATTQNTTHTPPTPSLLSRLLHDPLLVVSLALVMVTLPHLFRLPVRFTVLFAGLLAYRFAVSFRGWPQPSSMVLVLVAVVVAALSIASFETILGRDGGLAFLLGLGYLKLLEAKSRRDTLLMVVLGYFLTTTNFFFAQDIVTALTTTITLVVLTALLVFWERPRLVVAAAFGDTIRLFVQALPLTVLLFVFFPRPDAPLWSLPPSSTSAQTGLADEITPGAYNNLARNDAVAFRVEFSDRVPAQSELYWRGPVYDVYDGRTWQQGRWDWRFNLSRPNDIRAVYNYAITLEPSDKPWVLALDWPLQTPPRTRISARFQVMAQLGNGRRRFELVSAPTAIAAGREYPDTLAQALQVPPGGNPKARALAESWRELPVPERIAAAQQFFAQSGFVYTLTPPLLPETDGIDALLFSTKQGFCEHYAGAFAFLMRVAGVPTRVVGGYQGGQPSLDNTYLIVRQSAAHAWTESWVEGQGWQRLDPTAIIAPTRITLGLAAAVAGANGLSALSRNERGWWRELLLRLDAWQNTWNNWIISYDGTQQRALFADLGLGNIGSARYWLVAGVGLALSILIMLLSFRKPALQLDPVQQSLVLLSKRLAKLGLERQPNESARRYIARVVKARPELNDSLQPLAVFYEELRYGQTDTAAYNAQAKLLRQRVKQLRIG
jgi:protein-glutamine gamma-glutamyltransferase